MRCTAWSPVRVQKKIFLNFFFSFSNIIFYTASVFSSIILFFWNIFSNVSDLFSFCFIHNSLHLLPLLQPLLTALLRRMNSVIWSVTCFPQTPINPPPEPVLGATLVQYFCYMQIISFNSKDYPRPSNPWC